MSEAGSRSAAGPSDGGGGGGGDISLREKGNEFFKGGNYLKAAALYTQAIKQDPDNPTLYRFLVVTLLVDYLIKLGAFLNSPLSRNDGWSLTWLVDLSVVSYFRVWLLDCICHDVNFNQVLLSMIVLFIGG